MKFKLLNKFQEGGAVEQTPQVEEQNAQVAGAESGGAEQAIQQMASELVQLLMQQVGDPQAVAAILQMALEMVAGAAQEQAPVYSKQGGKLQRVR